MRAAAIAITPGEPAGIGADITLALAAQSLPRNIVAIADPELLAQRAAQLGISIKIYPVDTPEQCAVEHIPGQLEVWPVKLAAPVVCGQLNPANAQYVLRCLDIAREYCMTDKMSALVTGPVHKGVINDAGFAFSGHTEFLAERSHARPVMMLATDTLRVALATTHLPLRAVSAAINQHTLEYCLDTLHRFLKHQCHIEQPYILVCGLNPHAGEGGHLGDEEIEIIQPVIERARLRGMQLSNALPADTLFTEKYLATADAVLAMYHDQGLPVLKHSGFGRAVNITLGLPFVRTSVDHGTALDLAGTGTASASSLRYAYDMAVQLTT
jgi:4-hydroxythreonine-4-phosphate dehydrogenase